MAVPSAPLPRISVVVPSYNQGHFLPETLESIFRQGYPDLEVVVIDGGSTDDSVAVIRDYAPRLKYWRSEKDDGQSAAINAGVKHCTGDLVTWLNSDDYYWADSLWTVGRAYAAHPGHGLYIGNGFRYDQATARYTPFHRRHLALNREALTQAVDYILQPATFFLRAAWEEVGGLDSTLHFCMDWDVFLRVARRHSAVLINEFLAVSREYTQTKTNSGAMKRALEILRMVQVHSQTDVTLGSLNYLLDTLWKITENAEPEALNQHLHAAMVSIHVEFGRRYGACDGFPESGDPQDRTFLPLPGAVAAPPYGDGDPARLPSVSVIIPSFNQVDYLKQTLDSALAQGYPRLETVVVDGQSIDESVNVLRRYADRLRGWTSEPWQGPARAINKGLDRTTGEVLVWLNPGDLLTSGAVWEAARLFADDPELDLVYGNALFVDDNDRPRAIAQGHHRTSFSYGEIDRGNFLPPSSDGYCPVPQPTVFFRRRLLESCGRLNENYHFLHGCDLFERFLRKARIRKLERTQALYRVPDYMDERKEQQARIDLYRFNRARWPRASSREFPNVLYHFIVEHMQRRHGALPWGPLRWSIAGLVGLSAATGLGNPEAFSPLQPDKSVSRPLLSAEVLARAHEPPPRRFQRPKQAYRSLFCSHYLPRRDGGADGEVRDFQLLLRLVELSRVVFFQLCPGGASKGNELRPYLDAVHTPETILRDKALLVDPRLLRPRLTRRLIDAWRRRNLPLWGPRYHADATAWIPTMQAYCRPVIKEALEKKEADFLFVSPQSNPLALLLATDGLHTRLILVSHGLEAERLRRRADFASGWLSRHANRLEAIRAKRFESENLARFDGVIALGERDKQVFVEEYGLAPERVYVASDGVDTSCFAFSPRRPDPRTPVLFAADLADPVNRDAARRLAERIMPRVWKRRPQANLWLLGPGSDRAMRAKSDGRRTFVIGPVADIRPYLAAAAVTCAPLRMTGGAGNLVLKALAAGLPVVASPAGLNGLEATDGRHLLLRTSDEELAEAVLCLLDDRNLAARLAAQGRELVEQRHALNDSLDGLPRFLAMVAELPRRTGAPARRANGSQAAA